MVNDNIKFISCPKAFYIPSELDTIVTEEEFELWVHSNMSIKKVKAILKQRESNDNKK